MRTSLNEIHRIEKYLSGSLPAKESDVFKARLADDRVLRLNVLIQHQICMLTRRYNRKKIKEEADLIHDRLFRDPAQQGLHDSIHNLFNTYQ